MVIIQLNRSFLNREDRSLESRLMPDMPGILNWALAGLDRLIANGRFTVPESAQAASTMMMDLASPVSAFVRERCEVGPDKTVGRDLAYLDWKMWADANGHHAGSKVTFGRSLHAAVPGLGRADIRVGDKRVHGYRGVGLLSDAEYPNDSAVHPAQPAQNNKPASQNGFGGQQHPAQTATTSSAADKPQDAAQDDAQRVAGENRTSRAAAQDAQDETRCRSTNGHPAPVTVVPLPNEQAEPDEDGKSASQDFTALRRRLGVDPGDDRTTMANITVAEDKSPAPVRINGRPVDRSAHYKAPGKSGKKRRNR